jgi:polyisoprenoid-binding protein YceI
MFMRTITLAPTPETLLRKLRIVAVGLATCGALVTAPQALAQSTGKAATPAAAAPVPAALQAAGSEIVFVTKQMGVPVEGRFGKFNAQITLDPKRPQAGKVAFQIDTGSARFGSPQTDAEVPKDVWLNVAKFPQATFQSDAIRALGGGKFEVQGQLVIKGRSQPVTVPVQVTQAGDTSTATGNFTIQRLAFAIGEGEWADTSMVADPVQVRFKLSLKGLAPL